MLDIKLEAAISVLIVLKKGMRKSKKLLLSVIPKYSFFTVTIAEIKSLERRKVKDVKQ